ncbi:Protein of unknown function [Microlunatus sagamiharensis]|uniref:DUF2470 domain-containing protein n=1 Tax=Microlunatus sagamiharensis TaxID=546874 RepID=A0A1H2MCC3_9ACTN|nr:DUF2470 domain-containing protein [Microlunatus sagamiharensis]SDU90917.1 Protein of unknown function [Microlunatus sagamiharensis]
MDERETRDAAAVVARTVLSTSHEALCSRLDGLEHASSGVVGLLAAGAQPYLVPSDPQSFFPTGTALRVRVAIPGLGVVLASGTTGRARPAADEPGLLRTLEDHRACIRGPVDPAALQVVPLRLFALSVSSDGAGPTALSPRELTRVQPDWLLARGRTLTAHLEQDHADDLLRLAEAHGVPGATAVTLDRLTTRGARLVCLGADGVTTVAMVFDPPVGNSGELWRRLASAPTLG